jgi:phage tail sheath protein FI
MTDLQAGAVIAAAVELAEKRRAFYLVDAPVGKTLTDIATWANGAAQSRNAAVYFPPVKLADPLDDLRLRAVAPSGTLAGVYARTDATRGVWKAPAGTDATLNGVLDLGATLSDAENGLLNPKGVNVLRSFPAYGRVAWGARTMKGNDAQADEYKYVPVRRLALFLEESLYRGTQWVVFEPNDEPLWAQIRLNIGAFLQGLFRQGAFQGRTPREAYFVKCDRETTTQADINLGIVNIVVGFAPLKPAEFVVLKLQQIAGDIPT